MIKRFLLSLITALCVATQVFGQTASLLFVAPQQFFDNNGNPLSGGKVYYYQPNTLVFKTVWSDAAETTPLTNPVILDAAGRPNGAVAIYGQGTYRQIIKDANGNQIADIVTSGLGSGGGTSATGDGDLVGTIKPWAGLIAPNQYAFAYGQELSRTTHSALFTAITQTTNVTCASGSPILTNVSDTTQIRIGSALELSCVAPGTTVISKTTLTVTLSANSSLTTVATATFFPYGNGNGSTTFNLPDLRGYTVAGRDNMGGIASGRLTTAYFNPGGTSNPNALGAPGGSQSHTMTLTELIAHTHTGTFTGGTGTTGTESATHTHGPGTLSISAGQGSHTHSYTASQVNNQTVSAGGAAANSGTTGATTSASTLPSINVDTGVSATESTTHTHSISNVTGSFTTNSTGSSAAFSIIQPTITLNYIIKITPDTSSSVSTGVTSIQSMTGDIACGSGLICTGNIINISSGGTPPGGANTNVQFNNSGSFDGSPNLVWISPTLRIGVAGNTTGQLLLSGSTSGTVTITPQNSAGTVTFTLPNVSGTPAIAVPTPLSLNTTSGAVTWSGLTSGGVLYASGTTSVASSALLTANALVLGGGAGAAPIALGSLGTTTTVLHGNAAGAPTFAAVSLANDVTDSLAITSLAQIAANTVLSNWTGSTANVVANTWPSCSTTTSALQYTSGSGLSCYTSSASLAVEDQTLTGGSNVTSKSQSTGNITVDCGARPLQYITNGGAFTITAPSNDGSCILLVTNNASAGTITFSGFSVGTNTGDSYATTNTNKYSLFVWRINGTSGYRWAAHQ